MALYVVFLPVAIYRVRKPPFIQISVGAGEQEEQKKAQEASGVQVLKAAASAGGARKEAARLLFYRREYHQEFQARRSVPAVPLRARFVAAERTIRCPRRSALPPFFFFFFLAAPPSC